MRCSLCGMIVMPSPCFALLAVGERIIKVQGLPYSASVTDIITFFGGLNIIPGGVTVCINYLGQPSGEAFVEFTSPEFRELAMQRNRQTMGKRWIRVLVVSPCLQLKVAWLLCMPAGHT